MRGHRLRLAEQGVVWHATEGQHGHRYLRFSVVSLTWDGESRFALTALRAREGAQGLDQLTLSPVLEDAETASEVLRRVARRPDPVEPVHLADVVRDLLWDRGAARRGAQPAAAGGRRVG